MASNKLTVLKMNGVHNPSVLRSVSPNNNRDISQKFESRSMSPNPYLNVLKKSPVKDGKRTPSPCSNSENEESNGLNPQPRVVSSSMKMNIRSGSPNANDTASLKAKTASPVSDTKSACASINGTRDEPYSRNKTEKDETQNNTQSEQSGKIDTIATKSAVGKTEKSNKDGKQCNMIEATTESTRIVNTSTNGDNKLETQNNATSKKSDTMDSKSARFAKKKKQRAKRYKSDGFMLGLELGANSSDEEGFQLGNNIGDAVNFLQLIRNPNLQNLAKLRRLIKGNDKDWMKEFLEFDGLGLLFQCLKNLSEIQGFHLSDMVLRMECIMCIREVINSQSGLDCLLLIKGRKDNIFGRRFASALETKNLMVKMQIFELLSALCVYSKDGYYLTLDALERYRSWQKLQYRMSVLVNEVRKSELTTYKTTIMALINAIIFANENIRDRVRIRNEFLALSILDTIQTLRCEDDEDLFVQCDVFEEELNADTDALEEAKNGTVNLNDPQSVFTAVHKKVQGTPLNATFLGILHSLLQIEPHNSQSESTWTLIERVTQDALSKDPLSDTDFAQTVIKNHSKETREQEIQTEENNRLSLLGTPSIAFPPPPSGPPSLESSTESTAPVPPPPPPLPSGTAQVPQAPPLPPTAPGVPGVPAPPAVPGIPGAPPPPPAPGVPGVPAPPPAPGVPGAPPPPAPPGVPGAPPPPAPPGVPGAPPPPGAGFQVAAVQPPKTIDTPRPSMKMKTIAWNKIPVNSFKKESVWGKVLDMKDSIDVEYSKFEELFSQKQVVSPAASLSPETAEKGVNRRNSGQNHGEVTLLDPKKSMNINIFLKQFRKTNDAIIELIKAGDVRGLGVEKLKGMLKLLPLQDEADMLQAYDGEVEKLGNAEKFFYSLIQLNGYKLRIETMILKGDFNSQLGSIRPNIQTLSTVCRKLIDNDSLQVFLRFVLHAGNFINGGSSSGGAIGFRISSLNKLVNMKSNQPKMTLLHVLVQEAQQKNKGALEFVSDLLEPLQKASRFTLDGMIGEFSTLKTSVVKIKGQIENASEEVQQQFSSFIQEAESDITDVDEYIDRVQKLYVRLVVNYCENEKEAESDIKDVDEAIDRVQKLSVRLAVHYCENERSFKLDEFLEAFKEFCEKAKSCEQEIETWRINAEKAELRRQTQAQMMERRKSGNRQGMVQGSDQEKHKIVDNLVNEIRRGKVLRRLSLRRNVTDEEIAASGKK